MGVYCASALLLHSIDTGRQVVSISILQSNKEHCRAMQNTVEQCRANQKMREWILFLLAGPRHCRIASDMRIEVAVRMASPLSF